MTNYNYDRAYAYATEKGLEMPEAGDFAHEYEWAAEASPTPIRLGDYWRRWIGEKEPDMPLEHVIFRIACDRLRTGPYNIHDGLLWDMATDMAKAARHTLRGE